MARLNEPVVSTDSLETLRRKFLRQNRDIARVNSTQSLKIRSLENECARMLSENLDLRSQIIRLESELQDSRAQRIADHALEIKERMEAQLMEWGDMLAGLGHEPVPRNRSPRASKRARRTSLGRPSLMEWRRRDTMSSPRDLELAAMREGRLPPLWENKSYPRETLNREEIMALREIVEDDTESPDLGPPPVSRFVDEDPVKIDLPAKLPRAAAHATNDDNMGSQYPNDETESAAVVERTEVVVEEEPAAIKEEVQTLKKSAGKTALPLAAIPDQTIKAGLKRKARDEDEKENVPVSKTQVTASARAQTEKSTTAKKPPNRPMRDVPTGKKEGRDRSSNLTQRKPLGAKSSNENLNSPKKLGKPTPADEVAKSKADAKGEDQSKERPKSKKEPEPVEITVLKAEPAPTTTTDIEPETMSAEPNLAVPDTPEPMAASEELRDTPPPADISSMGETARGSRRARAAVSYAEPNLRDKMRRPSKQLYDAVSGEGKHIKRPSHSKKDEPPSGPLSTSKSETQSVASQKYGHDATHSTADGQDNHDMMTSPLVQKTTRLDDLPNSITTDRKKRASAVFPEPEATTSTKSSSVRSSSSSGGGSTKRLDELAAREAEVAKMFDDDGTDIYEFTSSSPRTTGSTSTSSKTQPQPQQDETAAPTGGARKSRTTRQSRSRRLSSMAREDLDLDSNNSGDGEKAPPARSRGKRASMMAATTRKTDVTADDDADTSLSSAASGAETEGGGGGGGGGVKERSMRRRSMML
ncbi:hypothetical protein F4780DRAFT_719556 [Xylariomycetidae sp. FL0641]|nr:hypothetical protein F4780DRAFT_719556 [Xylariomycetidae sp. FL0641]